MPHFFAIFIPIFAIILTMAIVLSMQKQSSGKPLEKKKYLLLGAGAALLLVGVILLIVVDYMGA